MGWPVSEWAGLIFSDVLVLELIVGQGRVPIFLMSVLGERHGHPSRSGTCEGRREEGALAVHGIQQAYYLANDRAVYDDRIKGRKNWDYYWSGLGPTGLN